MCCHEGDLEGNYIVETIKRIDRVQKEIVLDSATSCITCETSLITRANNTIPISLYTCEGFFEAFLDTTGTTTAIFRIECLRDNRFVTLRLFSNAGEVLTITNRTVILDLQCICGIQCYEAIDVPEC